MRVSLTSLFCCLAVASAHGSGEHKHSHTHWLEKKLTGKERLGTNAWMPCHAGPAPCIEKGIGTPCLPEGGSRGHCVVSEFNEKYNVCTCMNLDLAGTEHHHTHTLTEEEHHTYGLAQCPANRVQDCKDISDDATCRQSFYVSVVNRARGFVCSPCRGDPDVKCCSAGQQCEVHSGLGLAADATLGVNAKCHTGHPHCDREGEQCITADGTGRTLGKCTVTGRNGKGNVCACVEVKEDNETCAEGHEGCRKAGDWCCTSPGNMMTQGRCRVTARNAEGKGVCTCIEDRDGRDRGSSGEAFLQ